MFAAMKRLVSLGVVAAPLLATIVGCGGDAAAPGTPTPTTPAPAGVATITVSPPAPAIAARQTVVLSATARDASGAIVSGAITWATSDTLIAVVSASGMVAGISTGTATITATQGGKSASAAITVQPGALPIRGVWTLFEHLGSPGGYYNGEMLRSFDSVSRDVASQMDVMRSFGINAISLQLVASDSVLGEAGPPTCSVNPIIGVRWPQPTAIELANLVKFFDLAQQKGIRVLLELAHTHFEASPPTNATTWLTALINAVKNHPALELVTFMGDVHLHTQPTIGCSVPAEPPLNAGPSSQVYQHVKFELGLARSLGLAPRKVSVEATVGDYTTEFATKLNVPGTDHPYAPVAMLKQLFDELSWPDSLRTFALSYYYRRKCEPQNPLPPCVDEAPSDWMDEEMRYTMSTVGAGNGARVIAVEYGDFPDGASTPEQSVTGITDVMRRYGADGGAYWTWVETDNTYEAGLPFLEAVVRRGATLQFNPVKGALVKAYLP